VFRRAIWDLLSAGALSAIRLGPGRSPPCSAPGHVRADRAAQPCRVHIAPAQRGPGHWRQDFGDCGAVVVGAAHVLRSRPWRHADPARTVDAPSCSPRFYGATLAYLANFPLRRFCRSTPASMTCDPGGSVPTPPEVSWSPSLSGLRPGPVSKSQLFAGGSPVFAGSRRAVSRPFDVADCLGRGADHAVDYTIDDRQAAGAVGLVICWRGRSPVLAQEVKDTVQGLRIAPDPGTACRTGTEPRTVLRAHAP
jgi:hypothetical protein